MSSLNPTASCTSQLTTPLTTVVFCFGFAASVCVNFIHRNLFLFSKGRWDVYLIQLGAGFMMLLHIFISFYNFGFVQTGAHTVSCFQIKWLQFISFILFHLIINPILIWRITVILPNVVQDYARMALLLLLILSVGFSTIATAVNIGYPSRCSWQANAILDSTGKACQATMYILLLCCFVIPFNKILDNLPSSSTSGNLVSSRQLVHVSNTVILQISSPIIIYSICAVLRFANLGQFLNIAFLTQECAIFIATCLTYKIAQQTSVGQAVRNNTTIHTSSDIMRSGAASRVEALGSTERQRQWPRIKHQPQNTDGLTSTLGAQWSIDITQNPSQLHSNFQ